MLKKICGCRNADLGLLLMRVGVGSVFLAHGLQKLGSISGTTAFVSSLGFPSFFGPILIAVEVLGGLALIVGVLTRLAGLLIAIDMIFAIWLVKFSEGFIGGYEFELVLLLTVLALYMSGPGKYAAGKDLY